MRDIEQLQAFLRASAATDREVVRVDPFDVFVDESDELEVRNLQRVAFGQPPLDVSAETPEPGRTLAGRVDGGVVAAAGWSRMIAGVSEIVGVATAEPFRRRGLAGALTAAAARAAFDEGAEICVLSPGDETAMRVYERAGFSRVATMLHWSDD